MNEGKSLAVFQGKQIRRTQYNQEWYFSIVDIISVLTESSIPRRYWSDLKSKLKDEGFEAYDFIVQLKLPAEDGKLRETDCVNTKSAFRIIQSIPSPKAEPFKRWLAKFKEFTKESKFTEEDALHFGRKVTEQAMKKHK